MQTALSGQQALDTAGAFRPTAVLLDIGLPDLDGCALPTKVSPGI